MARKCILALAAAALVILQISAPRAFVQAPVAAGLDMTQLAFDAQLMLARAPGGKFAKEKDLVLPVPEEDGFSDAQVATCMVIAGVAMFAALDLAKGMERGVNPIKYKTGGSKGSVTPLVKRIIEMGQ